MSRQRIRPKRLAEKLLSIRQWLGLSQSQLTRRINPGMHYGRVSEWEIGKRQPGLLILLSYARLADVTIDDLVNDEIELKL